MPTEKNIKIVAELKEAFAASPLVLTADYRGLSVMQMNAFRRALRDGEIKFKVAKNTLAKIAADQAEVPQLKEIIDGPIGFATSSTDPAAAAKVVVSYIEQNSLPVTVIGAMLDREMLSAERVGVLARLPSRDELLAKLLGSMNSPITGLVMVMSGPMRAFATVLQRISELKETAGAAAPAAEAEA